MHIKNIAIVKPVDMFNKEDEKVYINESGLIVVEFEDNSRRYLDVDNRVDITNYKKWIPIVDKTTRMEYIFQGDLEYYN